MRRVALLAVGATLALGLGDMALATAPASAKYVCCIRVTTHRLLIFKDHEEVGFNFEPLPSTISIFPTSGTTFTGVTREEAGTAIPCHSEGAEEGEVKTAPLTTALGYLNRKGKQVGFEVYPTGGGLYASFTCGMSVVEWRGGLVYALTPANKVVKEGSALSIKTVPGAKLEGLPEGAEPAIVMEEQVNGGGFHPTEFVDEGEMAPVGMTVKVKANGKTTPGLVVKEKKKKTKK